MAFLHGEMLCSEDLVQFDGSSFENEFSASRHGIARVHSQVENDLVQLARVNLDDRGRTTRYHRDLDIISHERADKFHNVFESSIQVDQLGLQARFPSEGQQLACEGSAALDGFANIAYVLTRVASGIDAVAKQFGAGGDDAEDVIEIVCNPACQPADSFHLLSLAQMVFGASLGGDVAGNRRRTHDLSSMIADWRNGK